MSTGTDWFGHDGQSMYDWKRCSHEGIGLPGCEVCDPDKGRCVAYVRYQLAVVTKERDEARAQVAAMTHGMEIAWGVIANVSHGDWRLQHPDWREAAAKWRDEIWHPMTDIRTVAAEHDARVRLEALESVSGLMDSLLHCQPSCGALECDAEHELWWKIKDALAAEAAASTSLTER